MAKTYSCLLVGVHVSTIEIETVVGNGFSGLNILGLGAEGTRDMRERIRSALESIGIPIPARRVVVNITPCDSIKLTRTPLSQLDFPVAASIIYALFSENEKGPKLFKPINEFLAGEISLSGEIKEISNPLIYQAAMYSMQSENLFCLPQANSKTNGLFAKPNLECHSSLKQWLNARKGSFQVEKKTSSPICLNKIKVVNKKDDHLEIEKANHTIMILAKNPKICLSILVAALGGFHILIAGEPGVGKSFSLQKITHLLSPLTEREKINVQLIHSSSHSNERPFRAPHHTATAAALVGGSALKPGEVSLAHHGILFLDELAEFPRSSLEALREPLDSGEVCLSRAGGQIIYPAQFQLCATTNPCSCGYLFSRKRPCRCNPSESKKYLQKISGPLLDRFTIQLWVEAFSERENLDLFSKEFLNILETNSMLDFSKHFVLLQKNKNLFKDYTKIGQEYENILLQKLEYSSLSLRGQDKIKELIFYFQKLFPTAKNSKSFLDSVLSYRVLNKMFAANQYKNY